MNWRRLVERDWLVAKSWKRLHHAELTDEQLAALNDETRIDGPVRLACGQTAAWVSIPGVLSRLNLDRCRGCCAALGYPAGVGSPKNDPGCRKLMGIN